MRRLRERHSPETRMMLRSVQVVSILGLALGMMTLAGATAPNADWRLHLYITWFAIAIISVEAILHWVKAGIYALLLMTLTVTAADISQGVATMGSGLLGMLVVTILVGYLYPMRDQFD